VSTVPATPAAEPTFSTWSAKNRHLPAETWPGSLGLNLRGRSVCGADIWDQGALDAAFKGYGAWQKPPPRFTELPLCTKCARKAERAAAADARKECQ
jgi:hypothetical protein